MTEYHPLTPHEAIELAKTLPGPFTADANLECREIGDGNLNLVFHITDQNSDKSIIIKQALPYAKVVGESWPLSLVRARIEREILQEEYRLCPGMVPEVYHYDDDLALTVMEDLSDHVIMRKGLIDGASYPLFAGHIGEFMARTLFFTSDLGMNQQQKKEQQGRFVNPDQCKITEDLIFDEPYRIAQNNNYDAAIEDEAEALRTDEELHLEIALLREKFLTHGQALLHGDLHTGSIFVTPESTKVIDPEFAFYGPMGFDVGAVLANLLLHYVSLSGRIQERSAREQRETEILNMVHDVWTEFEARFRALWASDLVDPMAKTPGYQHLYVQQLFRDSIGFTGAKMVRRIVGLAHVADIDTIADAAERELAQRKALAVGKALLKKHRQVNTIGEVLDLISSALTAVKA
ncbi:S-methyl-5-thioribose kinase [Paenibacillus silvae]|uniref:S-methyl-5-thioribose kinase n=1 Tax=Paenibacillus silvae TaxID=1325358 RepID=UPI0011A2B8E6|nr:S-methyl-5-thioribose kinase [Paenibacillus xylanexedens]MCK6074393.1 S-methyl-5-thioribose kinase [Paenibacillus silvae]MCK6148129.1 S-methyl-5-thioribose kinase [Paenibacillus silvae]MCK6266429.1 S-methyl-5-thioribose kinase [Paenibacillus silvae]